MKPLIKKMGIFFIAVLMMLSFAKTSTAVCTVGIQCGQLGTMQCWGDYYCATVGTRGIQCDDMIYFCP